MYTVIIQSPETARLGRDWRRLFFEDFIDRGELDFCTWIKSGDSVDTALPALYDLIAGKREWRAVVVQSEQDRLEGPESAPNNPFDFAANKGRSPYEVSESDIPLIRLTQLLGGVPEPELAFDPVPLEEDGKATRVVYRPRRSEEAVREHRRLSEKYQFFENRPRELLVISTRQPVDNTAQEIAAAWDLRLESESSEFWHRNRYPSLCRFLVCDVVNQRHSLYCGSVFKLWCAVLLLALNQVEASTLQAYRLYRISVELDREKLSEAFSNYYTRMEAMLSQLEAAEANRESVESQTLRQAPGVEGEVSVTFRTGRSNDLLIDTRHLGLTRDAPREERERWSEGYRRATAALTELLRSPLRALDVAADDTRRRGVYPPDQVELLNRYQRADLEEEMEQTYFEALEQRAKLGFQPRRCQEERAVVDQQVRRRIAQRLTRKRALTGGLVCLGAVALGSLPYLIGAGRRGAFPLLWALLAVLACLGVCGLFGLAELIIQRREMADAMQDHNRCMREILHQVQASAQHYSGYLTALCTYLRGRSYLDREAELRRGRATEAQLSRGHRRAIQKCCALVRNWAGALGATVETGSWEKAAAFDAGVAPEENLAYRFSTRNQGRRIPLNRTGEELFSPYDFIGSVTMEREELYDDVDGHRDH